MSRRRGPKNIAQALRVAVRSCSPECVEGLFYELRYYPDHEDGPCGGWRRLRLVVSFYRMRHLPILCVIALLTIFLAVGCGDGDSQGGQEGRHGGGAKLDLRPEGDSGASGTASFEDRSFEDSPDGVVVRLDLRGLPKPNTTYLAHIHPGTCAEEAEEHAHEQGEHPEEGEGRGEEEYVFGHGEGGEISYALTQVESSPEGRGSSTTMFGQISVDKLSSAERKKHVMVHEAGSGNPTILACADLERAG